MTSLQRPVEFPPRRLRFVYWWGKERTPRALRYGVRTRVISAARRFHEGTGVHCPVCGADARSFFGRLCAYCGSGERHRLVALFLRDELELASRQMRILHFAPEPGLARLLSQAPLVDYVPADFAPGPGVQRVDVTDIQLEANFDGIIISHVLEHVPDDAKAMREMFRVLHPGGWAMVLVPLFGQETYENPSITGAWERHMVYGQPDHVRLYGRDISERLAAAGFNVAERDYSAELGPEATTRFGLNATDRIYLCTKPGPQEVPGAGGG